MKNSCQGQNGFLVFFVLFVCLFFLFALFIQTAVKNFNQERKQLDFVKTGFFNGVLSGKASSNKFMHRDQAWFSF